MNIAWIVGGIIMALVVLVIGFFFLRKFLWKDDKGPIESYRKHVKSQKTVRAPYPYTMEVQMFGDKWV